MRRVGLSRTIRLFTLAAASGSVLLLGGPALASDGEVTPSASENTTVTTEVTGGSQTTIVTEETTTQLTVSGSSSEAETPAAGTTAGQTDPVAATTTTETAVAAAPQTAAPDSQRPASAGGPAASLAVVQRWSQRGVAVGWQGLSQYQAGAATGLSVATTTPAAPSGDPAPVAPAAWLGEWSALLAGTVVPGLLSGLSATATTPVPQLALIFTVLSFGLLSFRQTYGAWLRRAGYVTAARSDMAATPIFATPHRWDYDWAASPPA